MDLHGLISDHVLHSLTNKIILILWEIWVVIGARHDKATLLGPMLPNSSWEPLNVIGHRPAVSAGVTV